MRALIGVHVFILVLAGCDNAAPAADRVLLNGAYTMKLEGVQGSIEVGKRADLAVVDRNLFEINPYEISDSNVTMTIFDGRTVYRNPE